MSETLGDFASRATGLARGPLGILALLIGLLEAMASMVLVFSTNLTPSERLPLVYFLVVFPSLLLALLTWLVARHPQNLYPPRDYTNENNFVSLMGGRLSELRTSWAYRDLDFLYLEVLKIGINNPRFINPELTNQYLMAFEGEERLRYESYAFLTWNVCETIFDRRTDKDLYQTWLPILRVENKLHRRWFDLPENRLGFKDAFQKYVRDSGNF
jgi:hypothetical protein